jgi:hypothetical protein
MFEKEIIDRILCLVFVGFLSFCFAVLTAGCSTVKSGRVDPVDYIKPATIEIAEYAIDERIAILEREIGESRSLNEATRAEISSIRESCETALLVSRRSGDIIQDTITKAEALALWVSWAYYRLRYLENILENKIQD